MVNGNRTYGVLYVLLGILLGLFFVFSGLAKLFPVEPLEFAFAETGFTGWEGAMVWARILIGLELVCGVLLMFRFAYRRFTLPLLVLLLAVFSVYLSYGLVKYGNTGDCGCFGGILKMTPVEGLAKNVVLLLFVWPLYLLDRRMGKPAGRAKKMVVAVLSVVALALPFVLSPVQFPVSQEVYGREHSFSLNLDTLYTNPLNPPPTVDVRHGKWIISFMSLTCPHCRDVAKKLHVMKVRNPALPIHLILNGKEEDRPDFFGDTRAHNLSWSTLNGPQLFAGLAGYELPRIYWVHDSRVVNENNLYTLDQEQIEAWLARPGE